ncbi:hypothetical protein BDD12DRAFT_735654 [Trichophaea hybrida]|nr:hypothetical protein BDD12DRAFT_735654 [Trichophaea hybrida]
MPPPDTWTHYILTSRRLHFYLSLGILASLAGTVTISNFLRTSPYAGEIQWSWSDPVGSLGKFGKAWKKSVEEESKRTAEMRRRKVEDVEKRGEYRRRHGLEQTGDEGGFGGFGIKTKEVDGRVEGQVLAAKMVLEKEGGKEGWVEEELGRVEEEAGVQGKEGKKGWW